MLGVYLYTLIFGHESGNILSIPSKSIKSVKGIANFSDKCVFFLTKK